MTTITTGFYLSGQRLETILPPMEHLGRTWLKLSATIIARNLVVQSARQVTQRTCIHWPGPVNRMQRRFLHLSVLHPRQKAIVAMSQRPSTRFGREPTSGVGRGWRLRRRDLLGSATCRARVVAMPQRDSQLAVPEKTWI